MMLDHAGQREAGAIAREAFIGMIQEGKVLTRDIGGEAGTVAFTDALVSRIQAMRAARA
jgi:isocitrate/isopropylmalate dehydrogenase